MYSNLATLQQIISITTRTHARFATQILFVRPRRNRLSKYATASSLSTKNQLCLTF